MNSWFCCKTVVKEHDKYYRERPDLLRSTTVVFRCVCRCLAVFKYSVVLLVSSSICCSQYSEVEEVTVT